MKLSEFLNDVKNTEKEVVAYCCEHILAKKYNIEEDSVEKETLKEIFVNYDNFNKSLADSVGVIYKKYEAEIDDIYNTVCSKFDVDSDNKSVFDYRLARVSNQEAKQFIDIEDEDTQATVIQKFEDKINRILESKYYNSHKEELEQELVIPQKTLDLVKSVASARAY